MNVEHVTTSTQSAVNLPEGTAPTAEALGATIDSASADVFVGRSKTGMCVTGTSDDLVRWAGSMASSSPVSLTEIKRAHAAMPAEKRTMSRFPRGAVVTEIVDVLVGNGNRPLIKDSAPAPIGCVRRNVTFFGTVTTQDAESGEAVTETVRNADTGETFTKFHAIGTLPWAIDASAFAAAVKVFSASGTLNMPEIKKRSRIGLQPSGNGWKVARWLSAEDVAILVAKLGIRTPASDEATGQIVLPVLNGAIVKAVSEAFRDDVAAAGKQKQAAVRAVKVEAAQMILGGDKPRKTAMAARAAESGAFFETVLIRAGRKDLADGSRAMGVANGSTADVKRFIED